MWRRCANRTISAMSLLAGVALLCGVDAARAVPPVLMRLPALELDPAAVTVSGLSSGGYMAVQFELAHSGALSGAAVLAAGPYGCAQGQVLRASLTCSCPAEQNLMLRALDLVPGQGCELLPVDTHVALSLRAIDANRGHIDDNRHLAQHRVWMLSGGADPVVDRSLVDALDATYMQLGVPATQIERVHLEGAGHGFPSPGATQACNRSESPFLNGCDFDAAGSLLAWLYPATAAVPAVHRANALPGALHRFRQKPYRRAPFDGLDVTGWVYVPPACEQVGAHCRLHVAFHGCLQGQSQPIGSGRYGTRFVDGAGYNRWAEGSGIVVLYPQVRASTTGDLFHPYRYNPSGCWDFWGYTERYAALDKAYATRSAPQIQAVKAVKAMVDDLLRHR